MRLTLTHPGYVAALVAVCVSACPEAGAQAIDEGPVIVGGPRQALKTVELDDWRIGLDLTYRYRRDHIDPRGGPSRTDTENLVRQSLTFSTRTFWGHRNLVDLSADGSIGYENRWRDSPVESADGHDTELVGLFDIRALVLGEGPAPVRLWARRNQSVLDRAFAGSVERTLTEYGASVRTLLDVAPTTLRYNHRETEQDTVSRSIDTKRREDTFSLHTDWVPANRQRLTADYAFEIVDDRQSPGRDDSYQRQDATLVHTWDFGPDHRSNLRSTAHIFDQTGDFANRTLRLTEVLRLFHSETFDSQHNLLLENREIGDQTQNQISGSTTLRHKLFDSLVSTASFGGSRIELPDNDFTTDEFFGSAELQYTKEVPYGRLEASGSLEYRRTDNSDRGSNVSFQNLPRRFVDPFPIVLTQRNVIESSIIITDIAGIQIYVEGLDYTLFEFDDRVEISRIVGGSIANGEDVLIDFDVGPEPANTIDSVSASVGVSYVFVDGPLRGLTVYVFYRSLSQDIDTETPSLVQSNGFRNLRFGGDYRIGALSFLAEQEYQRGDVSPFDRTRFSARYDQRLGNRSWLTAEAKYEMVRFTDEDNEVRLARFTGEWGHRFESDLEARLRFVYRDEQNERAGDVRAFDQIFELGWRRGQTRLSLSMQNSFLESDSADSNSQTLFLSLTRSF